MTDILKSMVQGSDGIYGYDFDNQDQKTEASLREKVNASLNIDYFETLSKHHSFLVMDKEVKRFLDKIPQEGIVIDIGGCWGQHWRNVGRVRPDVKIYIVDFIRSSLQNAKNILKDDINNNIFLIHGDATNLNFDNDLFDGCWTVQTLQHIPKYSLAIDEIYRVLKHEGVFCNYSFNVQTIIKMIYILFGKDYHENGITDEGIHLDRASKKQLEYVKRKFNNSVEQRVSEILFSPELGVTFPGKINSKIGLIDSYLSNNKGIFSSIARQKSYCVEVNKY